ncbi:MAG: hypothetical protein ACTHKZ_02490 [Lysobacteraceae bacterium]
MTTLSPSLLSPTLFTVAIAFAYYRRIRRSFGRQPYRPGRVQARLVLLALACAGLLFAATALPVAGVMLAVAIGLAAGATLGVFGVVHTQVEATPEGRWYTPNPWIGGALSVLLLARLAWRFGHGAFANGAAQAPQNASPLTLGIAAALVAFYLVNGAGLVWRMRTLAPATGT